MTSHRGSGSERNAGDVLPFPNKKVIARDFSTTPNPSVVVGRFDFETWTMHERIVRDGLTTYVEIRDGRAGRVDVNAKNWEKIVLEGSSLTAHRVTNAGSSKDHALMPIAVMDKPGRVGQFFRRAFEFATGYKDANDGSAVERLKSDKKNYLSNLASDIRRKQGWDFVGDIAEALKNVEPGESDPRTMFFAGLDAGTILLLAGTHNKFLAGVEGKRAYWKNVVLPPVYELPGLPVIHLSNPYINFLDRVRDREMHAVAERIIDPRDYRKIVLPKPEETLTGTFKDVLMRQAYTMRPEGIGVRLVNSGDVKRLVIVESDGVLFAKAETPYGDLSAVIDKDTALGHCSDLLPQIVTGSVKYEEMTQRSPLAVLVGQVYRDYLCADTKVLTGVKPARRSNSGYLERGDDEGRRERRRPLTRVILDDRRVSAEDVGDDRIPYSGKRIPAIVQVSGYVRSRKTGASEETKRKAAEWRAKTGLDLPVYDPSCQEAIVPGTRPPGMESFIRDLPEFWRNELNAEAFRPNKGFNPRPGS